MHTDQRKPTVFLPQFQYANGISRGEDPPDIIEVPNVDAAIRASSQGHGGKEFAAEGKAIAAGAGDTPLVPIAHHRGDHWGLLRDEHVLPVPFVHDS